MIAKFRIFDKKKKRFLDYFKMEIDRYGVHVLDEFNYVVDEDDRVLMQFTGLHDVNGVEIFEGDILEIKHPFRNRTHIGEVFKNRYMYNVKDFYFSHYDIPGDAFSEGIEYMEVIGNIHEHSHLLNTKEEN